MRAPTRFLLAALIGASAALVTSERPGDPALFPRSPKDPGVVVHLLDNGFHTDLAVPRALLTRGGGPLARATATLAPGDWVLVGWGDARFYVDTRPVAARLPDGARAFLRPGGNPSVVMLDPIRTSPQVRYAAEGRRTLTLSSSGAAALRARLESSFRLDADGRPILAASRPGDDARFFASRERFWVGHLCNHWTAELLSAAGLATRPVRAVTSGEVMRTAERAAKLDSGERRD